ncbi:hypothetical protein Q5752_001368 [Cryptotrichosporon argae]
MSTAVARPSVPAGAYAALRSALGHLFASDTPLLPFIPKPLKLVALLVLVLNASSFPFLWHLRVWYHPLRAYYLSYTRGRAGYWRAWKREHDAAGGLAGLRTRVTRRALLDDCDYNLHLSNSCYAKNSDAARMKYCIDGFAPVYYTGVHTPLAATHWQYLKEIPMGSEYTMETRLAGWGDKWLYLVTEFIIYPRPGKRPRPAAEAMSPPFPPAGASDADSASATATASTTATGTGAATPSSGEPAAAAGDVLAKATARAREARADGGVVCCVAVGMHCFKMGRVTVPPRIAMFLSLASPDAAQVARATAILERKDRGRAWLRGGWRDEADAETIGRDIGLVDGSDEWVVRGREAMEAVAAGLAVF